MDRLCGLVGGALGAYTLGTALVGALGLLSCYGQQFWFGEEPSLPVVSWGCMRMVGVFLQEGEKAMSQG